MSTAYGKAQVLCSQAVTNVRTVVSFGSEERIVAQYKDALVQPTKTAVRLGVAQGLAAGCLDGVTYSMCDNPPSLLWVLKVLPKARAPLVLPATRRLQLPAPAGLVAQGLLTAACTLARPTIAVAQRH